MLQSDLLAMVGRDVVAEQHDMQQEDRPTHVVNILTSKKREVVSFQRSMTVGEIGDDYARRKRVKRDAIPVCTPLAEDVMVESDCQVVVRRNMSRGCMGVREVRCLEGHVEIRYDASTTVQDVLNRVGYPDLVLQYKGAVLSRIWVVGELDEGELMVIPVPTDSAPYLRTWSSVCIDNHITLAELCEFYTEPAMGVDMNENPLMRRIGRWQRYV